MTIEFKINDGHIIMLKKESVLYIDVIKKYNTDEWSLMLHLNTGATILLDYSYQDENIAKEYAKKILDDEKPNKFLMENNKG